VLISEVCHVGELHIAYGFVQQVTEVLELVQGWAMKRENFNKKINT